MPESDGSLAAVVVSGGKQYRVTPGALLLVDRIAAEPGSEVPFARVLLVSDGDDLKVGSAALEGVTISARVVAHRQGPKIDVLRYKSKKRVRVHRGARAQLTALEVLEFGASRKRPAGSGAGSASEEAAAPKRRTSTGKGAATAAKEEGGDGS